MENLIYSLGKTCMQAVPAMAAGAIVGALPNCRNKVQIVAGSYLFATGSAAWSLAKASTLSEQLGALIGVALVIEPSAYFLAKVCTEQERRSGADPEVRKNHIYTMTFLASYFISRDFMCSLVLTGASFSGNKLYSMWNSGSQSL